ncbi:MAG: hypothetical protein RL141_935 [Candidatus Parcubacteria bacterium]|jgi:hypothetical protein
MRVIDIFLKAILVIAIGGLFGALMPPFQISSLDMLVRMMFGLCAFAYIAVYFLPLNGQSAQEDRQFLLSAVRLFMATVLCLWMMIDMNAWRQGVRDDAMFAGSVAAHTIVLCIFFGEEAVSRRASA